MNWDEIALIEGRIYCQKQDTWCAFVNMNDGTCNLSECVNIVKSNISKSEVDDKYG